MREQMAETVKARSAAGKEIADGTAGVAGLASVGNDTLSDTWASLAILPLGFCDETLDRFEREDAQAAIGRGGVWEPSALFVVQLLPDGCREAVEAALVGSIIAQQTLDDVAGARASLPQGPDRQQLGYDPVMDGAYYREWTEAEVERDERRVRLMLELAKRWTVRPAADATTDERVAASLADEEVTRASQTIVATLVLAHRLGLPIYSDDRHLRLFARQLGVRSFGTLALLDVLAERKLLAEDKRLSARRTLSRAGAWGIGASVEELVAEAQRARWQLTVALRGFVNDRAAWRSGLLMHRTFARFLGEVDAAAPDQIATWVARGVDASMRLRDDWHAAPDVHVQALLAVAWNPFDERMSNKAFHRILREVRRLPLPWRPRHDPVLPTLARLLSVAPNTSEHERSVLFRAFIRRLPAFDDAEALLAFVQR